MIKVDDFRKSLQFVLLHEVGSAPNGGYTNDPDDPGGETKYGISKRAHPAEDIKNMTPERAMQIYDTDYWTACGCDSIVFPLNTVVFDSAVVSGPGKAKLWLRLAANVQQYLNLRRTNVYDICSKNPSQLRYRDGWLNRIGDLSKFVEINQAQNWEGQQQWGSLG